MVYAKMFFTQANILGLKKGEVALKEAFRLIHL